MVYAQRVGAYGSGNAILMERFKGWAYEKGYMDEDAVILGIVRDDACAVSPAQCRYDVCLLGNYEYDEEWIKSGNLDAGRYVVIEFPHTAETVGYIWQNAFPFLMGKGYSLDFERPVLERYKKKLVDQHLCEMMFPLKLKK